MRLSEDTVEQAALEWLRALGYGAARQIPVSDMAYNRQRA